MRERFEKLKKYLDARMEHCKVEGKKKVYTCSCWGRGETVVTEQSKVSNANDDDADKPEAAGIDIKQCHRPVTCQPMARYCHSYGRRSERRGLGLLCWAIFLLVAVYFVPDLPERMPVLYGVVDLTIDFCEWSVKVALGTINALLNWNLFEFLGEVFQSIREGWKVFVEFLSGISL